MKILGHTPEGDLIIQVSQAEWEGLQDGVKPKEKTWLELWDETEAGKLLGKGFGRYLIIKRAFKNNQIDGSLQSLRDIASGKIIIDNVGVLTRDKLMRFLDDNQKEHN